MQDLLSTDRVHVLPTTSATDGYVVWDRAKSLWLTAHICLGLIAVTIYPSWSGFGLFIGLTSVTICAGHSVGMHRLLIHRSFSTPLWLERLLVWLGVLVGMAGPFGMIRAHDLRDWHQRQIACPPHPAHRAGFWRDAWWQLHCRFDLTHPPRFTIEDKVANDPFYRFVDRFWMGQQLPLVCALFLTGGLAWVLWGVSARIAVSLIGHWLVGHFAHHSGHQGWRIDGVAVQGYNLPGLGLWTFGENWHGNHHAFPHSALLGVEPGQRDPGFWFIRALARAGLAQDIHLPNSLPDRVGLKAVSPQTSPLQPGGVCPIRAP